MLCIMTSMMHAVDATLSLCRFVDEIARAQCSTNDNRAIVNSRLRPRCPSHDECCLLVCAVEQNLAGISAAMLVVFRCMI